MLQHRQESKQKFAAEHLALILAFGPDETDDSKLLEQADFLPDNFPSTLESGEEFDGTFTIPAALSNTRSRSALPELDGPLEARYGGHEYTLRGLTPYIVGPVKCLLGALAQAIYLGPYRRLPSRNYPLPGAPNTHDWASGLEGWQLLIRKGSQPLVESVNSWLSNNGLDTGYVIAVQRCKIVDLDSGLWRDLISGELSVRGDSIRQQLSDLPELTTELKLKNTSTGMILAPQDLGVGISQVIPVLVAAMQAQAAIVAIEEPEAHIHPAWQVVLADLFITQAKANPGVMFLVETHSEHLMLRCLRRIRETSEGTVPEAAPTLRPEEIAVHFVEPEDGGPRIHRIRIDEDGEFRDPWPRGFFRERSRELYGDDL